MSDDRPVIAVIGASGFQGGAVARALVDRGAFRVRAVTRNPTAYDGPADEVVRADLTDPGSIAAAFAGAYGVFAVSSFREGGSDEVAQGRVAVLAAVNAGVRHFVWSTLPNVETLSGGEFTVPHFTNKAEVDPYVRAAGFEYATFVEAPFYFENFLTAMAPQPLPDGRTGWALPIPADARVVHAGSISDLGGVVAGAFDHPDIVGAGSYLSSAADLYSFNDFADGLETLGHSIGILEVTPEAYGRLFPGAEEMAQMLGYFARYTYLGPNGDEAIRSARHISTTPSTDFTVWATVNMAGRQLDRGAVSDSNAHAAEDRPSAKTFMVMAGFSPETDLPQMKSVITEEAAQVQVLRAERRLGAVHVSVGRGKVFLEVLADDEAAARATVQTLPMATWWDIDIYPTTAPSAPAS